MRIYVKDQASKISIEWSSCKKKRNKNVETEFKPEILLINEKYKIKKSNHRIRGER